MCLQYCPEGASVNAVHGTQRGCIYIFQFLQHVPGAGNHFSYRHALQSDDTGPFRGSLYALRVRHVGGKHDGKHLSQRCR